MNQFDYLKIAEAIFSVTKDEHDSVVLQGQYHIIQALSEVFKKDNPKFNEKMFEKSCFLGILRGDKITQIILDEFKPLKLRCAHCGREGAIEEMVHIGGQGLVKMPYCENRTACWRQYNKNIKIGGKKMERKAETKVVKTALIKAGYADAKVGHGTGTAWGWIHIHCNPKPDQTWQEKYDDVIRIVQTVTGRHGEYDNIGVNS